MNQGTMKMLIDGKEVLAKEGDTILKAAKDNEIYIPTLCSAIDGLSAYGGCRLCLVETRGTPRLLPACTTPVSSGMDIVTNSERLTKYRRSAIELLLAERSHVCSVCVANGSCELQDMATELGVDHVRVSREWTGHEVDASHERFVSDPNRCILCTRCIRVCDEIEGVHTLDLMLRGKESKVVFDMNEAWGESRSCTACRKCTAVCPVGALYVRGKSVAEARDKNLPNFVRGRRQR